MEIIKKISFLFYILFFSIKSIVLAQSYNSIGQVTISSPNAASLGKYGDIPVSYHTGIPEINIPLYTIKSGSLELPISISYHASGLKVQEQASWVGAGWSLNAGGVITRTVIGAPDDRGLGAALTQKGHFSDYGYSSYLFGIGPANCDPNPNGNGPLYCPTGSIYPAQDTYIQSGIFDGEPDLYFFNFNGKSGKFYFNDDRTAITMPEQDMKISVTGTDWRGINGFTIVTSDGTTYYFGQNKNNDGNIDAIDTSYNVTTQNDFTGQGATSSWYLNKIVSVDGQSVIVFTYAAEKYSYYTLSMYPIPAVRSPNWYDYNLEYDLDKNFINGVRLLKINFANGEMDFAPGNLRQDLSLGLPNASIADAANLDAQFGGRALSSISITDNNFCKKYLFYNSYFYDGSSLPAFFSPFNLQSDKYRLRLDSIAESSCDNTQQIPSYKFYYFQGIVPRKLSFAIDHWGFYNGVSTNTGLIPTYRIISSSGLVTTVTGADRDVHWPYSLNGTLQQVYYPTGGYSNFQFESNSTWCNQTTYAEVNRGRTSIGPGIGQQSAPPLIVNFTSNPYKFSLDFYSEAQTATGGSANFAGLNVDWNSRHKENLTYGSGTGTFYLSMYNMGTSDYATASVDEEIQNQTTANCLIGGIRIKAITNNDGTTSHNTVTSYGYNFNNDPNGQSSGILYSRPIYVEAMRNDAWGIVGGKSCSEIGCFTCFGGNASYYQSPSSIRPMSTSQGNHIGYAEVYVSQSGNGYSKYEYYNSNGTFHHPWDPPIQDVCVRTYNLSCDPSIPNSPAAPDPFDPWRGEVAKKEDYSETGQLIKSTSYIPQYQFDSLITPGIISKFFVTAYVLAGSGIFSPIDPDPFHMIHNDYVPIGVSTFTEYTLQSVKKISDSIITIKLDPNTGNYLTDINATYYQSPYHHEPIKTLSYSSKGEKIITKLKYAFDFKISNFNVPDQLSAYYTNINNDNTYLGNALGILTTDPTDPHYYWQRINIYLNYRYKKVIDRQSYIAYRNQTFNNQNNTYTLDHDNAKSLASSELKPILELQDQYSNPPIEITKWKDNNLIGSNFTHYDYASNPAGFVYPNKTQLVNLNTISNTFISASVSGNTLIKDSMYQDEALYKYNWGNPIELTPKSGVTTAYIWDYNNIDPIAKVINAKSDKIAYTSFEADGAGNWTIPSPLRNTTTSVTGNQCYSLSNGDITKNCPAGTYLVTLWARTQPTVSGTAAPSLIGRFYNGFTYYEFKTSSTSITIHGTGFIDELRLYPIDAQMTTYTYEPLIGMTSACDVNNRITYYSYDGLGRLSLVKDQDGNILKKYDYVYGDNSNIHPDACDETTNCKGSTEKCVHGYCEAATRINQSTRYLLHNGTYMWKCTYDLRWTAGAPLLNNKEYNAVPCDISQ